MLRIPHCLDSRLTDGGEVVSLTHRPLSTPQKLYFSTGRSLLPRNFIFMFLVLIFVRGRLTPGTSEAGSIRQIEKKFIHLIWHQTRDLPACSMVPHPSTLPQTLSKVVSELSQASPHTVVWWREGTAPYVLSLPAGWR
jgi:hypothetical protein